MKVAGGYWRRVLILVVVFASAILTQGVSQSVDVPGCATTCGMVLIYSGLPNPRWELTRDEVAELAGRMRELPEIQEPPSTVYRLRYRGILIESNLSSVGLPEYIWIFSSVVRASADGRVLYYSDTGGIELWLVQQACSHLGLPILDTIRSGFQSNALSLDGLQACAGTIYGAEATHNSPPPFEPTKWNFPFVQAQAEAGNNCYNYALNEQTGDFRQPGVTSGYVLTPPPACADVAQAVKSDGLIAVDKATPCPSSCHRIALFVAPSNPKTGFDGDFHFYRQDANGN